MMALADDEIPENEEPSAQPGGSSQEASRSHNDTTRHREEIGPAALAGASGADTQRKADELSPKNTPERQQSAISKLAKRAHKKAAKVLGYALVLGDFDAWEGASGVWQARLTETERAALAWAALRSLDHDAAVTVAETALGGAGPPDAPLFSEMDQAAFWADMASPTELDAYALASVRAMTADRRTAFLEYMHERDAA